MNLSVRIRYEIISLWNGISTVAVIVNDRLSGIIAGPNLNLRGGENEWQEN
ncbi:hypothetical protein H7992_21730 [Sporosarcina sp. resist]|uniref:hypothetical protein n=1 Tax=Sporosarcina sp. resist TaxID=2762563 RepID=UPI00164ECF6F|nr:hypothetical protein [Sporosarcina sp. resist]QNK87756.1 hypothetical protein H7992_21730 [Sporosarcina sp. resist]